MYTIGNTTDDASIALHVILDQSTNLVPNEQIKYSQRDMWCSSPGYKTFYWSSWYSHWWKTLRANQVKYFSNSYSSKVKMLRRICFLTKATPETIYYKTIIPSVLYGVAMWDSSSVYLMKNLELVQLRASRLIHRLPDYQETWKTKQYS